MRPLADDIDIHAPPYRVFIRLVARWEMGDALGVASDTDPGTGDAQTPACRGPVRMGVGFHTRCPALPWQLPRDAQLVVTSFSPPYGWTAVAQDPPVAWEIRVRPGAHDGSILKCSVGHAPTRWDARLRERLVARRRRARTLRHLLRRWRADAERQEGLHRLRSARQSDPPPHAAAAPTTGSSSLSNESGGTDVHTTKHPPAVRRQPAPRRMPDG
ncbi:MAG: hypothetical protein P8174_07115 [Gemmatimonadota bacterium]